MVKFLVIRFSSIGDIVLTTPVVRGLKQQVKDAQVHFLTKPAFVSILQENPHIDKIHSLSGIQNETVNGLKQENFDYVIDLQNNLRSLDIKRSLKRMYITVNKLNVRKWLLVNLRINMLPEKHIVDRYLETTQLFDVKDDGLGLDYFIPADEEVTPDQLPGTHQEGYIAVVIGANHQTKKMPLSKLTALCDRLEHPSVLIGGPEDKAQGEQLAASQPGKPVLNGCGSWSINQSASVIQNASVVITHDTGMMHIASAFRKPVLTIWGNTVPAFGMYAYKPGSGSDHFEVEGLSCRPCSKLGKPACPKKHFRCMADQDTDSIARKANAIFRQGNHFTAQ